MLGSDCNGVSFSIYEEASNEITQLHTGLGRQTGEWHRISLIVQDVAPVFRKTMPKLIVYNSLRMENELL
jgi:hypothetical protein